MSTAAPATCRLARARRRRRPRGRRATLLTTLALTSSTSVGVVTATDRSSDALEHAKAKLSKEPGSKSSTRENSRFESIDELGQSYFDVSDWTTSQDEEEISPRDELANISQQYGIQAGKWTWPYPLTTSDVDLLSDDERAYLEQEFGVVMPGQKEEDGHRADNTEGLVSANSLDDDDFVAPDVLGFATQRERRRRLTSVEVPTNDQRKLRGKKHGGIAHRADPRQRRQQDEDLSSNDTDESVGESENNGDNDDNNEQRSNTYRCIDDSPDNSVPCPPDNMGPICDKYNPQGSFRECYGICKPSFCCIHDSRSQNLSPTCAQTEPNCESYFACYIIWWRLSNTIGPATYLRVPQSDESFYDASFEDVVNDLAVDQVFREQFFGHHFDTDVVPTDSTFEDPANW